jgi:hypothetical protein
MSNPNEEEVKEYADGWITERKGTDAPAFLKFAYIIIAGGCVAYLLLYMNGETGQEDRGVLVQAFNAATTTANGLMYFVAALGIVYGLIVVAFVFRKFHD